MNDRFLRLYHLLPGAGRSAVATLRGIHLRKWRYGAETETLIAEALEREQWSAAQWQNWQEERLARALDRAARLVPYYRKHWAQRRQRGDASSCGRLENWPLLEKDSVRTTPHEFVADDCDIRRMFHEHTSGTTGKSLDLWWSREMVRQWYALFEARWRRWYGVSRRDRWAILGGQLVVPVRQRRPPFWVWNAALNQLYMSSYHLAPELIPEYLDALVRYRIGHVIGYSSALYSLARESLRLGRRKVRLAVAITNAEPLMAHQRETMAEAFGCPVRETYGMSEAVAAASECEQGRLHLWPEVGLLEVSGVSESPEGASEGELVCTGLLNMDMPLVRYRVGDRGGLTKDPCSCGRTLPVLTALEGRTDDVLFTPDGRRVGRLDPVFKSNLGVREAQIIQESIDTVRVKYVVEAGFTLASARSLSDRVRARMGDINVVLEQVNAIPRTASGKFRAVICNLESKERTRLHGLCD